MASQDLLDRLPHRPPLLLLDSITHEIPGKSVTTSMHVKGDEFFFNGHFPGYPIMPGVILLEALAQTGALLRRPEDTGDMFIGSMNNVRFYHAVHPDTRLVLHANLVVVRPHLCIFACTAVDDEGSVASAEMAAILLDESNVTPS